MNNLKKAIALCLALLVCLTFPIGVSAASVTDATIDMDAKASLTVFKYDITNSEKDGVWDSSYVSTGVYDQNVNDTLGGAVRDGDSDNQSDLGNGQTSYGSPTATATSRMWSSSSITTPTTTLSKPN